MYDEPFADSSQIPTFLVSSLASRAVTVALTGDGGDELFGGYSHYADAARVLRLVDRVPLTMRPLVQHALRATPTPLWDAVGQAGLRLAPGRRQLHAENVLKVAAAMTSRSVPEAYAVSMSRWGGAPPVAGGVRPLHVAASDERSFPALDDPVETMMFADTVGYLCDDILVKVDRAAMATSLETRIPMLDPAVFTLAWQLPMSMKRSGGEGKIVLRRLLERYLPTSLVDRPKMGFAVPLAAWLRAELREWASDLLDASRLRQDGFLDERRVTRLWNQHLRGTHDWKTQLWTILMFQAWLREWERQ
jgi:asparagine synthase (glutamine-hydrolysing)